MVTKNTEQLQKAFRRILENGALVDVIYEDTQDKHHPCRVEFVLHKSKIMPQDARNIASLLVKEFTPETPVEDETKKYVLGTGTEKDTYMRLVYDDVLAVKALRIFTNGIEKSLDAATKDDPLRGMRRHGSRLPLKKIDDFAKLMEQKNSPVPYHESYQTIKKLADFAKHISNADNVPKLAANVNEVQLILNWVRDNNLIARYQVRDRDMFNKLTACYDDITHLVIEAGILCTADKKIRRSETPVR